MVDSFRCLEAECMGKTFKSKQALAGHVRWKKHSGDVAAAPVQLESRSSPSRSSPKLRSETTSAGLGEITPREPLRETRSNATVPDRGTRLEVERRRLADILQRPQAETSIFDGPDKLVAGIASKLVGPVTERFESAILMIDRIKKLPRPPLPRLPRPPWPF